MHDHYHRQSVNRAVSGRVANLSDIEAFLCGHVVPLRAPLVLISQVQRSGGTLLSQLFDAHSALAAYPHELRLGYANADSWPRLDPALGMDKNFRRLYDLKFPRFVRRGFTKGDHDTEQHQFLLVPTPEDERFAAHLGTNVL